MKGTSHKKYGQSSVATTYTVLEPQTLSVYLSQVEKNRSCSSLKSLLSHRQVAVNGTVITAFDYHLRKGDVVEIYLQGLSAPNPNHKIKFIYEDDYVLIIDKKHGTFDGAVANENVSTAYSIALEHVKRNKSAKELFFVHRLEREASGLLLFAKSEEVQARLCADKEKRMLKRTFVVVVEGQMSPQNGTLTDWLKDNLHLSKTIASKTDNGGRQAILSYKTLKTTIQYSLLEIEQITDVRNQIRVQLSVEGHPIVGDKKNGSSVNPLKRICLHATRISFYHPVSGKKTDCSIPVPKEFL